MTNVADAPEAKGELLPVAPRGRLVSIDVLRGLAALGVLLYHIRRHPEGDHGSALYYAFFPLEFGPLGVVLFIVISGFCIHLGTAKGVARGGAVRADWRAFWWRRSYRLYPPYLAAVALSLAIYYGVRQIFGHDVSGFETVEHLPLDLVTHLLMVHNLFADYIYGLGNGSFWSLGLEEQLYALYALLLVLRRRMPAVRTLYIALAVTVTWKLGVYGTERYLAHAAPDWVAAHTPADIPSKGPMIGPERFQLGNWQTGWPFSFWFAWVLGAVAAEAYAGVTKLPDWCSRYRAAALFAILGLVTDWNHVSGPVIGALVPEGTAAGKLLRQAFGAATNFSDPFFALASFVLINAWMKVEMEGRFTGWWVKPLARVGLMSYSLYLVHTPLLRLAENVLPLGFTWGDVLLRFALFVPYCLVCAALFFAAVERPFLLPPGKPKSGAA